MSHELRVLVDGRALVPPRSGIGVHTAEIAGRLDVTPPPLIASQAEIANREGIERCRFRVDRAPNGILWQQFVLPRIADADVLWAPHGTIPMALKIPSVVTLHDFTSLTMPGRHRIRTILSYNIFITSSLERARRVAAVSKSVADEAVHWFAVPRRLIEIVPNGVDEFFQPGDGQKGNYILFVGTIEPRKGVKDLAAVWWSLPEPRPPLLLCGQPGWRMRLPDGVDVTGWVDRQKLRTLYQRALMFVYPSRYEGFGIPPLEAMACGAPVIATRTGAIGEYGEDVVQFVEPGDLDGLRAAMLRLLRDEPLRRELGARGAERAKEYRWTRSAELMTELLVEASRR